MLLKLTAAAVLGVAIMAAQTPRPGTLLVASPQLRDEGFARTVILIIRNDGQAALGLVLNRPLADGRFAGGPVASGLRSLIRFRTVPKDGQRLFGDVYLVNRSLPAATGVRVFAGYTGWSSGQLRQEVELGWWRVVPPKAELIFDPEPATLWKRLQSVVPH
ncbi:YqgE/AlgH family protein [uncultured Paludibaculum sp.]|uniref:YqgE/AlgH family protein n=1 Tax=uncultured Paludibaculum sp. TaxID=1765020 RepID=UPI002AAB5996|nr:YqgE/AlgH family protein [uncultured Paludibaculum sp.]